MEQKTAAPSKVEGAVPSLSLPRSRQPTQGWESSGTDRRLLSEAARRGEPGYAARIMVGGGLTLAHLPRLRAAGIDAFHIGGAARPQGWDAPVSASAVAEWRKALSQPPAAGRFGDG